MCITKEISNFTILLVLLVLLVNTKQIDIKTYFKGKIKYMFMSNF